MGSTGTKSPLFLPYPAYARAGMNSVASLAPLLRCHRPLCISDMFARFSAVHSATPRPPSPNPALACHRFRNPCLSSVYLGALARSSRGAT